MLLYRCCRNEGTNHSTIRLFTNLQFENYLSNINNLDELEYVFYLYKGTEFEVKNAFKELFTEKRVEIFKSMKVELRNSLKIETVNDLTSNKIDVIINLFVKAE